MARLGNPGFLTVPHFSSSGVRMFSRGDLAGKHGGHIDLDSVFLKN